MLRKNPDLDPKSSLLDLCHRALRSTRGAAVAVARIDRVRNVVTFSGVGNVEAAQVYVRGERNQHLVLGERNLRT